MLVEKAVQDADQRHQGVRRGATIGARVSHPLERAHGDVAGGDAAQRGRQLRLPGLHVAAVVDDEGVAADQAGVGGDERLQIAPRLLLSLHQHLDPDRRLTAEEAQRGGDDHHAGLVVGGTAAIHAPIANLRLEGVHVPPLLQGRGLDVIVGVEQDRRRARGRRDLGVDGGIAPGHVEQPGTGDAVALEQIDDRLRCLDDGFGGKTGEGAGRNADQGGEVFSHVRHDPLGERADGIDRHM